MRIPKFCIFMLMLFVVSCSNEGNPQTSKDSYSDQSSQTTSESPNIPSFEKLPPERTGINFINRIKDTKDLNIYTYEYFYNGSGVAVGDVNNDGLPDLYFSCNQCPNKLYLNKGNLQFENITKTSGIEARGKFKTGTAMMDINNDGFLDIFALRSGKDEMVDRRNYVYINNKDLTFANQSSTLGLDAPTNTVHVNFIDYDKDGDMDVFYGNHPLDLFTNNQFRVSKVNGKFKLNDSPTTQEESQKLYRNDNGKFTNVAESAGIARRSFALSSIVSDFNDDGYPDIYVGNDYIDPDYLFINQKNGKFRDERASYFKVMTQNTMGTDYEDVNNDGLMDLFASDMLADTRQRRNELAINMVRDYYDQSLSYGYGAQVVKNALQINQGNGKYLDQSYMRGVEATDWSWASLLVDLNNSGSKDLYVTNGYRRDVSDLDFIDFRDENLGKAMDVSSTEELMELIPSTPVTNKFYVNDGNGFFTEATKESNLEHLGFSHGAVYADLDNDGDLELIVSNLGEPASIYKNMSRENNPSSSNYLSVKLRGPNGNRFGINAKVTLIAGGKKYIQEYRPMKGYLSSVEHRLHFGLGSLTNVDNIEIEWPDGKVQTLSSVKINQEIEVFHKDAKGKKKKKTQNQKLYKRDKVPGLVFKHNDKKYNDFNREPFLMYKHSDTGPAFAVDDINSDGLNDYYIGGAANQRGSVAIQLKQGGFGVKATINKTTDGVYEETDALFFDADGDSDKDLYIVSGGSEKSPGHDLYQDRLFLNDGSGIFTLSKNIPSNKDNGSCVSAGDYDGDGDLDLFVGSHVVPGRFPEIPVSRILENDNGTFKDVSNSIAKLPANAGLITDAEWVDLDGDNKDELICAGEWMSLKVFQFDGSNFVEKTKAFGLVKYSGLWQNIKLADLDKDGDLDIVAGNFGLNSRYSASEKEPLTCYGGDLDNNDFIDPIMCMFSEGKNYPVLRKDVMSKNLPMIKKKFVKNVDYASATIDQVFDKNLLDNVPKYQVTCLESCIFLNENGSFKKQNLPIEAQSFPVKAIEYDPNSERLFLAGSIDGMEVINGPNNAGRGLVLQKFKNGWKVLSSLDSGIDIPYSTRSIKLTSDHAGKPLILVANHNGPLAAFKQN